MNDTITIYTDGACSGNPGKGGWGAVLISPSETKQLYGGVSYTTNNKMELQAVIEGLKALYVPYDVIVYTDSVYVKEGISKWILNWKKNGWITAKKKTVKNKQLWQYLDMQVSKHKSVKWVWVKGHSGDRYNEIADELARKGLTESNTDSDAIRTHDL